MILFSVPSSQYVFITLLGYKLNEGGTVVEDRIAENIKIMSIVIFFV
jgi:hypothetical protein